MNKNKHQHEPNNQSPSLPPLDDLLDRAREGRARLESSDHSFSQPSVARVASDVLRRVRLESDDAIATMRLDRSLNLCRWGAALACATAILVVIASRGYLPMPAEPTSSGGTPGATEEPESGRANPLADLAGW